MDILSPWLGATIESELGQVLQYRGIDSNRTQSIGRAGVLSYEDDGSNLRIKSDKKGPVLQISKV